MVGKARAESARQIALWLERSASTITRELAGPGYAAVPRRKRWKDLAAPSRLFLLRCAAR